MSVGEYLLYTNARKKADEALDDNGSYGVKEKVRAIRDLSWLNVSKQQALLILDTRTKDNPEGLANEIEAILGSGLSFDEFLNVYERHNEIYNEEDLSASAQALKYANWLDGRYIGLSVLERIGFSVPAISAPSELFLGDLAIMSKPVPRRSVAIHPDMPVFPASPLHPLQRRCDVLLAWFALSRAYRL